MRSVIEPLQWLLLALLTTSSYGQSCLTCSDTPTDTTDKASFFQSKLHLIQVFGNFSYNNTLYYQSDYKGDVEWVETRVFFPALSRLFKSSVAIPDPYLTFLFKDLKELSWEQRIDYGFGIEWRPLKYLHKDITPVNWLKHLRFYLEKIYSYYYYCDHNSYINNDFRVGLELYRECNLFSEFNDDQVNVNRTIWWSEFWGDFSYRQTNFTRPEFKSWSLGIVPRLGLKVPLGKPYTMMPYFVAELTLTGHADSWQNRLLAGAGLRMMPFRTIIPSWYGTILHNIKIYFEYTWALLYFRDPPDTGKPKYNLCAGINFSINRY